MGRQQRRCVCSLLWSLPFSSSANRNGPSGPARRRLPIVRFPRCPARPPALWRSFHTGTHAAAAGHAAGGFWARAAGACASLSCVLCVCMVLLCCAVLCSAACCAVLCVKCVTCKKCCWRTLGALCRCAALRCAVLHHAHGLAACVWWRVGGGVADATWHRVCLSCNHRPIIPGHRTTAFALRRSARSASPRAAPTPFPCPLPLLTGLPHSPRGNLHQAGVHHAGAPLRQPAPAAGAGRRLARR